MTKSRRCKPLLQVDSGSMQVKAGGGSKDSAHRSPPAGRAPTAFSVPDGGRLPNRVDWASRGGKRVETVDCAMYVVLLEIHLEILEHPAHHRVEADRQEQFGAIEGRNAG